VAVRLVAGMGLFLAAAGRLFPQAAPAQQESQAELVEWAVVVVGRHHALQVQAFAVPRAGRVATAM
jgi:hypothetical protein